MHAKQHDIFFWRDWELNPSPSGSRAPRALANVLAHRATRAGKYGIHFYYVFFKGVNVKFW